MVMVLFAVLIIVILFLFFYPFKVCVWNEKEYFYIKISWIVTIKINMLVLFDNKHNDEIKRQVSVLKILNKIRIESLDLKMSGLNLDYEFGGEIYGYLNIILAILKNYLLLKKSKFNYDIRYMGDPSIKFKGIIYSRLGIILKQIYGGKGNEGTSN